MQNLVTLLSWLKDESLKAAEFVDIAYLIEFIVGGVLGPYFSDRMGQIIDASLTPMRSDDTKSIRCNMVTLG